FFSGRRRHTRFKCDWSSDVCSSDLVADAMSRQVDRELALARLRGKVRGGPEAATELAPLVDALLGTLGRTPAAAHVSFDGAVPQIGRASCRERVRVARSSGCGEQRG